MAQAAAKTPTPEVEAPAAKRVFAFVPSFTVPIPANADKPQRQSGLPFKDIFTANETAAKEGKQPHLFVPKAFWVEDRGAAADKVTTTYQRGKLNEQFKAWVAETEAEGKDNPRAILSLTIVNRTGKEGLEAEGIKEEGISVWMVTKK